MKKLSEAEKVSAAGGSEKAHSLHASRNKVLVRERVNAIKDEGSQVLEIGLLAGYKMEYGTVPSASTYCAIAPVHGVLSMFIASDATVKGGTIYPITLQKNLRASHIALQNNLASVHLVDSGGAFLPLQSEIFPDRHHGGRQFYNIADHSSVGLPQVSIVCGSCTAGGAYQPSMCDEMVFVDKMGTMFLGGPPLVQAATGEKISAEELGGARMHCSVSGCADYFAQDEEESSEFVRTVFETLNIPKRFNKLAAAEPLADFDILSLAGLKLDSRFILSALLDASRFHEFKAMYGKGLLCGYGRIGGHLVAVVSNNGDLDAHSARKGAHFVHLASERAVPIIFLQNSLHHDEFEGEENSKHNVQASAETVRARAALISAVSVSPTAKVTICCAGPSRRSDLCPAAYDPNFIFRWPNSTALRTGNPEQDGAIHSSARMWDDGTIDPRQTRNTLIKCLDVFDFSNHHRRHIVAKNISHFQPMYRL